MRMGVLVQGRRGRISVLGPGGARGVVEQAVERRAVVDAAGGDDGVEAAERGEVAAGSPRSRMRSARAPASTAPNSARQPSAEPPLGSDAEIIARDDRGGCAGPPCRAGRPRAAPRSRRAGRGPRAGRAGRVGARHERHAGAMQGGGDPASQADEVGRMLRREARLGAKLGRCSAHCAITGLGTKRISGISRRRSIGVVMSVKLANSESGPGQPTAARAVSGEVTLLRWSAGAAA